MRSSEYTNSEYKEFLLTAADVKQLQPPQMHDVSLHELLVFQDDGYIPKLGYDISSRDAIHLVPSHRRKHCDSSSTGNAHARLTLTHVTRYVGSTVDGAELECSAASFEELSLALGRVQPPYCNQVIITADHIDFQSYPLAIIGGCPALRRGERPLLGVHGIADMVVSTSALRPVKSIRAVEIDFTTSVCCALHFPGVQVSGVFCLVEE
eukprot:1196041-Prorocentrum_minimum.AAC.6